MPRNNILIYIQQDATLHSLFISGDCSTCFGWTIIHHQERKQLYLQHLVFVIPLLLSATIVEELEPVWVCCGCQLQHTQTGSISSTIAKDSSNGVRNTRCCRWSWLRSWRWVMVPPETCRAVSRQNKLCNVASCWIYIRKDKLARSYFHLVFVTQKINNQNREMRVRY